MRRVQVVSMVATLVVGIGVGSVSTAGPSGADGGYQRPTLTITTNKAAYRAGDTAAVTITMTDGPNYAYVDLFSTAPGRQANWLGEQTLVVRKTVDVVVTATTQFTVTYGGTDDYAWVPSVASTPTVAVSGSLTVAVSGAYGTSRGAHLVHSGHLARVTGSIAAAQYGQPLYAPLQVYRDGTWRAVRTLSAQLRPTEIADQPSNSASVTFGGARGGLYRVREQYRGDRINAPQSSGWSYVRFA